MPERSIGPVDVPFVGNTANCRQTHVYQTFAAGLDDKRSPRQTQCGGLPTVRRLCSAKTLGILLADSAAAKRFEIIVLPPQSEATEHLVDSVSVARDLLVGDLDRSPEIARVLQH